MLEAHAHKQLKKLLKQSSDDWPHNLTLARLVARSLRRRDHTFIEIGIGSESFWWIGLLVPLCIENLSVVLVLSSKQRFQLINVELPKLKKEGLEIQIWEGNDPPPGKQLWLIEQESLIANYKKGLLKSRQLIIPEAENLTSFLRDSLSLKIIPDDWEELRRLNPSMDTLILDIYERLSRKLFSQSVSFKTSVSMEYEEIIALKDIIRILRSSPNKWSNIVNIGTSGWASWAELDPDILSWIWNIKPLKPLLKTNSLFIDLPTIFLSTYNHKSIKNLLFCELSEASCPIDVHVNLSGEVFHEPLPLFAPKCQPLPNTEFFLQHLSDSCKRLILGLPGITIILIDDSLLRTQITSLLAAEFGVRVVHEVLSSDINGVICCSWSWWLDHYVYLPAPQQLIIGLFPIPSLSSPLVASQVEYLKCLGKDWFRELLLPESLKTITKAISPVRKNCSRLAILDGRLWARSWGETFLNLLEPYILLKHLLPD